MQDIQVRDTIKLRYETVSMKNNLQNITGNMYKYALW